MTNDRAIELLRRISDSQFDGIHGDERREALEMAVRALEPNLGNNGSICTKTGVNDEDRTTGDCISRQAAIVAVKDALLAWSSMPEWRDDKITEALVELPSAQPERTEYIPDTKAVRSKRDCVDLAERVVATFYDQEHEEWTQKTVTIADVLDSVCDEYTILPSAQPERKKGKWLVDEDGNMECPFCGNTCGFGNYCNECGADMRGGQDG